VVSLRRQGHPAASEQDRQARDDPGRRSIEAGPRCGARGARACHHHPLQLRRHALDRQRSRSSWRKACKKAGVAGLTFHDLGGSTITRLAVAGATVPEIANINGLSLGDVRGILDRHYISDDVATLVTMSLSLRAPYVSWKGELLCWSRTSDCGGSTSTPIVNRFCKTRCKTIDWVWVCSVQFPGKTQ
jgi:hypothetical protein